MGRALWVITVRADNPFHCHLDSFNLRRPRQTCTKKRADRISRNELAIFTDWPVPITSKGGLFGGEKRLSTLRSIATEDGS